MTAAGLPTIWELVAEGAATLPEPFSRAALINWVSARRPDVGVPSIAAHIQFATANAAHSGHEPFAGRPPLLERVERGRYLRYREPAAVPRAVAAPGRVVLIGSSGATVATPGPAAGLFENAGFARARERAARSGHRWFVLSAKHGLLDPDDVVGPSDVLIGDRSTAYRTAWAEWVVAQLADRVHLDGVVVEVHGGVDFAQPLRQPLARQGAGLEIPLPVAWQEWGPDCGDGEPVEAEAPVRAALGRLRELVTRHRPAS